MTIQLLKDLPSYVRYGAKAGATYTARRRGRSVIITLYGNRTLRLAPDKFVEVEPAANIAPEFSRELLKETPEEEPALLEEVTPIQDLEDLTKAQLGDLGRDWGVELDLRQTKAALIDELRAHASKADL